MNALILGATGATGRHVAKFLLEWGHHVRMIVRSAGRVPDDVRNHPNSQVIEATLLEMSDDELKKAVKGCDAVISCLGHNLSFKGIYGKPRRLVRDATRRLCIAVVANKPDQKVRYVLMNTSGNRNRDLNEHVSIPHRMVIAFLRLVLPPHPDNEQAADHLRVKIGQSHPVIEWVAVRPDGLIDEDEVTDYTAFPSPIRDALFDAGKVSRINVAHFMARLAAEDEVWSEWKGQMPVVYGDAYVKEQ